MRACIRNAVTACESDGSGKQNILSEIKQNTNGPDRGQVCLLVVLQQFILGRWHFVLLFFISKTLGAEKLKHLIMGERKIISGSWNTNDEFGDRLTWAGTFEAGSGRLSYFVEGTNERAQKEMVADHDKK